MTVRFSVPTKLPEYDDLDTVPVTLSRQMFETESDGIFLLYGPAEKGIRPLQAIFANGPKIKKARDIAPFLHDFVIGAKMVSRTYDGNVQRADFDKSDNFTVLDY